MFGIIARVSQAGAYVKKLLIHSSGLEIHTELYDALKTFVVLGCFEVPVIFLNEGNLGMGSYGVQFLFIFSIQKNVTVKPYFIYPAFLNCSEFTCEICF